MHRFLIPPEKIIGQTVILDDPREVHHLRDVVRLRPGDALICFDGQGQECAGTIRSSRRGQVVIDLVSTTSRPPHGAGVWLAQGLPKGERFEWIVQKATELGVERITPLLTRHAVVKLSAEQGARKQTRWQRIAAEAAKQCGRATVPQMDAPSTMAAVLPRLQACELVVMPTLAGPTQPLHVVLDRARGVRRVGVLIGPEGDFHQEEVVAAQAHGAQPVSLGELTLRSETAAVATVAILRYVLSDE
jgi:16S rRNA (uracil1498-N3)-methyltransferase